MASEINIELADAIVADRMQTAKSLIRGLQIEDPKLYECLMMIMGQMSEVTLALYPITETLSARVVQRAVLVPPINLTHELTLTTIRLRWDRPDISGILQYEVRFGGTDWDHAQYVIRTPSTTIDVPPFKGESGLYRVKTLNDIGDYSDGEATTTVLVVFPGPVLIIGQVIDNNVLLQWTASLLVGSFATDYYEIKRGNEIIGIVKGTFTSYFEVVAGLYTYTITAIDIAGNYGLGASIELLINQPPDYVLQDERSSAFDGTKFNVLKTPGPALLCNVPSPQTWQQHFVVRTWLDPQDQVSAGYPIYIQPANTLGWYEEIFDFGVVLSNVITTVRFNTEMITVEGTMLTVVRMAFSDDGVNYTSFINGTSQFVPSLRFLKLRLEFTASDDKVLMRVFNLLVNLAVKRENDGGETIANAGDALGTQVNFNKAFKDVESVTATVKSPQEPFTVVVDFQDVPNPTGFKVFVLDTSGARVTKVIEWKARGVV